MYIIARHYFIPWSQINMEDTKLWKVFFMLQWRDLFLRWSCMANSQMPQTEMPYGLVIALTMYAIYKGKKCIPRHRSIKYFYRYVLNQTNKTTKRRSWVHQKLNNCVHSNWDQTYNLNLYLILNILFTLGLASTLIYAYFYKVQIRLNSPLLVVAISRYSGFGRKKHAVTDVSIL